MLNAVHKQLLASRLKDMFVSSPLMLVYQTLGSVRSTQITQALQSELDKRQPGSGIKATCFKIKNTIAGASGDQKLARFLQANNILVGWQVPELQVLRELQSSRTTTLSDIMKHTASKPSPASTALSSPLVPGQEAIPQRTMSALIDLSMNMPGKVPVVLLAGFYRGEQVGHLQFVCMRHAFTACLYAICLHASLSAVKQPLSLCCLPCAQVQLKHLKQWMGLDDRVVMAQLLAELDGIGHNLLEIGDVAEALVATTSAAEPHELLSALDMKAAGEATTGSTDAAASAQAPAN